MLNKVLSVIAKSTSDARFAGTEQPLVSTSNKFLSVGFDHGIDFSNQHFLAWFIGVPASFLILANLFRSQGWWAFTLKGTTTRASDDLAFEIVAGSCCLYLAVAGIIGRFGLFGANNFDELEEDPFYAGSDFVKNHLSKSVQILFVW